MAVLKVKDVNGNWVDVTGTGSPGPAGGAVPVGGNPGEVIVKTGAADFEVGWVERPRVAFTAEVSQVTSHATINTFVQAVSGQATIYPDRMYHIFAGCRGIQDPGGTIAMAQAQVSIGTVNLTGYDVWVTPDTGLWGSWSQQWVYQGSDFTALAAPLDVRLNMMLNVASKTFYSPRLTIIEY